MVRCATVVIAVKALVIGNDILKMHALQLHSLHPEEPSPCVCIEVQWNLDLVNFLVALKKLTKSGFWLNRGFCFSYNCDSILLLGPLLWLQLSLYVATSYVAMTMQLIFRNYDRYFCFYQQKTVIFFLDFAFKAQKSKSAGENLHFMVQITWYLLTKSGFSK